MSWLRYLTVKPVLYWECSLWRPVGCFLWGNNVCRDSTLPWNTKYKIYFTNISIYRYTRVCTGTQISTSSTAAYLAHFLEALLQADGLLLMGGDSVDLLCQRVHHLGRGFWGVHGETHHTWQVLWACHPVVYHHCVVTRVCPTDTLEC